MKYQQITEALQQLQESVQSLQTASGGQAFTAQFQNATQSVQDIATQVNNLASDGNKAQVEGIRQQIAQLRRDLRKLSVDIEQAQASEVNKYRSSLGASKEMFEMSSASEQQTMNMTAYQSLQTYRQENQLLDQIRQVNEKLMDVSHQVEQLTYSSQIPAPTYGKPADFTTDRSQNTTTS